MPMKRQLIAALEFLPDDATFDDAIERLYLEFKLQVGLAQADQGMLIPNEEVMKRIAEWLE
jgi:predicted transcriptional regulator